MKSIWLNFFHIIFILFYFIFSLFIIKLVTYFRSIHSGFFFLLFIEIIYTFIYCFLKEINSESKQKQKDFRRKKWTLLFLILFKFYLFFNE